MNSATFAATYQALWGDFPAKEEEEARIWVAFTDQIPDDKARQLFDAVEKLQGEYRGKPRLREFRRAWRGLQSEAGTFAPKKAEGCCLCDDTGYLSLPAAVVTDAAGSRWVFETGQGVTLEFTSWPCRCPLGRVYERRSGLASSVVEEARAIFQDYRQAAGHRTEGPYQSRTEFLANPVGCSVVGIMRGVIRQSRIDSGELVGAELELVRSQDSARGTTVAAWRSSAARKGTAQPQATAGGKDANGAPSGSWHRASDVADEIIARVIAEHPASVAMASDAADFPFGALEPRMPEVEEQAYNAESVPF